MRWQRCWVLVLGTVVFWSPNNAAPAAQDPITRLKPLRLKTELVAAGQAQAAIVLPTDAAGQQAARRLQAEIERRTGAQLPLVSDEQAWQELWGNRNLVVVGNLMTNRVFAMLYCLHYACSDGAWPGQGGYEVRTVCDARGLGRNLLVVGGSDASGVDAAVDALLKRITPGNTLVLDHFIDTRVDGKPYQPFSADALEKQSTDRIQQAVNYYRTGNVQYAELAKRGYLALAKQMESQGTIAYTSGFDWLGICWDLLEEAPVFSEAERLVITNGLVTFMEKCPRASQPIQDQPRPFHGVDMLTVHIYDTARYFADYYPDCQIARRIMDRERLYWSVQRRYWTQDCQSSWYQGSDGAYLVQYALQALDFEWFETGRFKRWLEWYWASCNNSGGMSGYGDAGWGSVHPYALWALQVGAWHYGEGWMQWLADRNACPRRDGFNLGHSFYTGLASPEPPYHLGDLYKVPLEDWMYQFHRVDVPREKTYNKVSCQDGYQPGSPYLLLDGTGSFAHGHPSTNQIVCFTSAGQSWLIGGGYMVFQIGEHNMLSVYRDGGGSNVPSLAELRRFAHVPGGKFVQSVVKGYGGVDWSRSILWRDGGTVVVIDRAIAVEPGKYAFQLAWRCNPNDMDQASRTVHVARPGAGTFHLYNADTSTMGVKDTVHDGWTQLYQSRSCELKAGDTYTFRNLFFVTAEGADHSCTVVPVGEGAIAVREPEGVSLVGVGPLDAPDRLSTDAALFWIGTERVCLVDVTRLAMPGTKLTADSPVSLTLDVAHGALTVNAPGETKASVTVSLGSQERTAEVAPGGLAVALGGLDTSHCAGQLAATLTAAWDEARREGEERTGAHHGFPGAAPLVPLWRITNQDFQGISKADAPAPRPGNHVIRAGDVDGDGNPEILVGRADRRLYCLEASGQLRWSFEAPAQVWDVWADDVDGDGTREVALVCSGSASSAEHATLFLLDHRGKLRWQVACPNSYWRWAMEGYPSPRSHGGPGSMLLCWIGDFNGDGRKEIGCAARNFFVYFFDAAGRELWEQLNPYHRPLAWRAADLDGDGRPELCVATDFATNVFALSKSQPDADLTGGGKKLAGIGMAGPGLDVADLAGDGKPWIIHGSRSGQIAATRYDPAAPPDQPTWQYSVGATVDQVLAVNLRGGKDKQVLAVARNMHVYCLDAAGKVLWYRALGEMVRAVAAADLDGDNTPELLVGCDDGAVYWLSDDGRVLGTHALGAAVRMLVPVFPHTVNGCQLLASTFDGGLHALRWQRPAG